MFSAIDLRDEIHFQLCQGPQPHVALLVRFFDQRIQSHADGIVREDQGTKRINWNPECEYCQLNLEVEK